MSRSRASSFRNVKQPKVARPKDADLDFDDSLERELEKLIDALPATSAVPSAMANTDINKHANCDLDSALERELQLHQALRRSLST